MQFEIGNSNDLPRLQETNEKSTPKLSTTLKQFASLKK